MWGVSPQFPPAEGVQNFWTHPLTFKETVTDGTIIFPKN